MASACRWSEPARARSRKVATPVAKSTSLSSAPRTVFMRSARGVSLASPRSKRATVGGAGPHLAVDPDLADLVHDDGDRLPREAVLEHVAQERRLPAAEEAGQDVDRDRAHQSSGAPASPSGTGCPIKRSSVGAMS